MSEQIVKPLTSQIDFDYKANLYFIDGVGNVCSQPKNASGEIEILIKRAVVRDNAYLYYVDKEGGISRHPKTGTKFCVSKGTQVLTDDGLKSVESLTAAQRSLDRNAGSTFIVGELRVHFVPQESGLPEVEFRCDTDRAGVYTTLCGKPTAIADNLRQIADWLETLKAQGVK